MGGDDIRDVSIGSEGLEAGRVRNRWRGEEITRDEVRRPVMFQKKQVWMG